MSEGQRSETADRKATLRVQLRERLAGVTREQALRAASGIADRVLEVPEVTRARGILACLSFGTEPDTWKLVDRLLAMGRKVYVPRADPSDGQLHVHAYPCELRTLSFGLRQPPRGTPEVPLSSLDKVVDVALVLGLAFDRQGYRLGHGSGYFDRFLAGRSLPGIGLAYHLQRLDELPREPHDVPMAAVVTELGTWRAEGR